MDFTACYRRLALEWDCDWQQARRQYQALVAAHHPDRGGDHHTLAEINYAWQQLQNYYRQHHCLPLQPPSSTLSDPSPATTPFVRAPRPARRPPAGLLLIAALVAGWLWLTSPLPETAPAPSSPVDTQPLDPQPLSPQPLNTEPLTAELPAAIIGGEPMGWIIERLGPPDQIVDQRWYYRSSWIGFRDGRVSEWQSTADDPLPTATLRHGH